MTPKDSLMIQRNQMRSNDHVTADGTTAVQVFLTTPEAAPLVPDHIGSVAHSRLRTTMDQDGA